KLRRAQTTQGSNYAGPKLRRARTTQGPNYAGPKRQERALAVWVLRRLGRASSGPCVVWAVRRLGPAPFGSCAVLGPAPFGSCVLRFESRAVNNQLEVPREARTLRSGRRIAERRIRQPAGAAPLSRRVRPHQPRQPRSKGRGAMDQGNLGREP